MKLTKLEVHENIGVGTDFFNKIEINLKANLNKNDVHVEQP